MKSSTSQAQINIILDSNKSIIEEYKELNDKCDIIINKIKKRKKRKL